LAFPPVVVAWLAFLACAAVIVVAGSWLSRYGDVIADKTGLGGTWIGLALLATVTSLPELVTGVSAVTLADAPNIALGDVLGSCVFNLLLLTILDVLQREESVFSRASRGHILSAGFGVILIGIVGFNLLLGDNPAATFALGHVGAYSLVIVLIYAVAMRTVFRYEQAELQAFVGERAERYPDISLRQAAGRYAAAAAVVVGAGLFLPFVAKALAAAMGWHLTFVGTLFVAAATSLPEGVVTVSALRIGALDMAVSNLLGSNLFNILILAIDDAAFLTGPILAHVSPLHGLSALSAIIMTGVVIVGLLYRPRTRLLRFASWASLMLFSIYLTNSLILYLRVE
jgi:cation:H+ antiporter